MEDLSKQWTRLSLLDREGDKITLGKNRGSNEHIIAAKFLTRRALNVDAIGRTFKPLWRAINGFTIKNMGNHILLFIFENQEDVTRVLNSEPWSFDKHLVVVQEYERNTPIKDVSFNKTSFCVQVYDIPIRYMTKEVAEEICSLVGEVCRSKTHPTEEGGCFVRVRVKVDVTQPLCRGRVVNLEEGDRVWVSFKYERLPIICYWCGRLDHDDRDCLKWIESKGSLTPHDKQFGSFMHATETVNSRKTILHVSGFFEDRGSRQANREKPQESLCNCSDTPSQPETAPPPPTSAQSDMETPDLAENAINTVVTNMNLIGSANHSIPENMGHTINKEIFSQQLLDIDLALQKYESHGILHEDISSKTTEKRGDPSLSSPVDSNAPRDQVLVTPRVLTQDHTSVDDLTAYGINSQNPLPFATWKRVPRKATANQEPHYKNNISTKRSIATQDSHAHAEFPNKKLQVSPDVSSSSTISAEAMY